MRKQKSAPSEQAAQSYEFRAEIQQLLNILVHSLYTDREIFLRELVSNASVALNCLQFEMLTYKDIVDPDAELAVHCTWDKYSTIITVNDSGIGMIKVVMITNFDAMA